MYYYMSYHTEYNDIYDVREHFQVHIDYRDGKCYITIKPTLGPYMTIELQVVMVLRAGTHNA